MTVRELIEMLEEFDGDMEVRIGMIQKYGSDFAMDIADDIAEHNIRTFYGENFRAVILTEGEQIGTVDYDDDDDEEDKN